MRTLLSLIFFITIVAAIFICLHPAWHIKNATWKPNAKVMRRLAMLGDSAIISTDVPVAALLLYNNNIIGSGYNTVRKEQLAGGHAEINTITAAMRNLGVDSFFKINHERLTLITTWEPCLMCRGALAEYNIKHVIVIKAKPIKYWLQQWKKLAEYEWNKQNATSDSLQEHLFRKHPQYQQQKKNY